MKKIRKILADSIKAVFLLMLIIFCLTHTENVFNAVYDAVMRCINIVIPSLYGMMILSGILVKSGIPIQGIFPIFILSQFSGYPVGAKILAAKAERGDISYNHAEIFSGICFGAGPAFIFGCISSRLYGNSRVGNIILISAIGANIILAVILLLIIRPKKRKKKTHGNEINLSPEMITQCILSSGRAMADICIMITAFSVLTALLDETGIIANISECISSVTKISPEIISGVIYAAIDVTNVEKLPQNNYRLLPLITGIVSSGGLCVIMQIAAVTSGKIRIRPLIILRVSAAFLSGILCRILMPLIIDDAYISVSAVHISSYNTQSPVPSVILIIMTGFLFYNYEGVREKISSGNLRQQNDFAKKGSP